MKLPSTENNDSLHLSSYWQENDHTSWCIFNYDMSILEKSPGMSKRCAHSFLKHDLNIISILYPETECFQRRVKYITKELKNSQSSKILDYLWSKTKDDIITNTINKKTNMIAFESSSINMSTKVLDSLSSDLPIDHSNKKREHEVEAGSSKDHNKKHHPFTPEILQLNEIDGIFLNSKAPSVGTIIKQNALLILKEYTNGAKLSTRRRKIMVAGLSSILDLSDNSNESQKSLFTYKEWQVLNDYFNKKFPIQLSLVPHFLTDTWTIISNVTKKENNVQVGKNYIYKLYSDLTLTKKHRNILKLMEHCLDIMDDYPHLLSEAKEYRLYTEQDYFRILWSRIFELLFVDCKHIRIKSGESIPAYSTYNKKDLYPSKNNVYGFKIDARILVDVNNEEFDLATLEAAKDDEDAKIIDDLGKLIREAKDNEDKLIEVVDEENKNKSESCFTWLIQLSGATCQISTIHLASNGLYVVLPRFNFSLPNYIHDIPKFQQILQSLLTMKHYISTIAACIIDKKKRRNSINERLGKVPAKKLNSKLAWARDTWYSPSKHDDSAIPKNMFGFNGANTDIFKTIIQEMANDEKEVKKDGGENVNEDEDEFGYIKISDGWYNKYTKKYSQEYPLKKINY
ncbi:unnamed protein product [Cunninghamella blakesleeana]